MITGDPAGARPRHAAGTRPADAAAGPVNGEAVPDADQALASIYGTQYRSLVRLAALLIGDSGFAEEVVRDSFIAMHRAGRRLRDRDKALSYLCQSVVNRSRSIPRHRIVADRNGPKRAPDLPSVEPGAATQLKHSAVSSALRRLSPRQREAVVLKFYLDLSDGQVASAMGTSRGAVKSHTTHGMAALRGVLELET